MHTKLTLRLDEELIKKIKAYSKKEGKSVSQLIADFVTILNYSAPIKEKKLLPITQSLKGILKGHKISEKDYKKYLEDKYL